MKFALLSSKLKWILALTCGLFLAIPLVWWQLRQRNSDERIYRIGFSNQPPQHFPGKDGKPKGLVVELINEAARRRRIRLQWSMEPESSEAALKMNKVDLLPRAPQPHILNRRDTIMGQFGGCYPMITHGNGHLVSTSEPAHSGGVI